MRRGSGSTVVVAVAAALAALVVLLWASGQGEHLVGPPQGTWERADSTPGVTTELPDLTTPTSTGELEPTDPGPALDWLLLALAAGAIAIAILVLRQLLGRERDDDPIGPPDEDELTALLEATGDDVRYRALAEGDPRNAVVACWVALEDAVSRAGLAPDHAETSSELTERVLTRWQVDPAAITTLSAAYREARFSRHPVTETQRSTAIDALERIHTDLRRRADADVTEAS